jgi:hypothetical protein
VGEITKSSVRPTSTQAEAIDANGGFGGSFSRCQPHAPMTRLRRFRPFVEQQRATAQGSTLPAHQMWECEARRRKIKTFESGLSDRALLGHVRKLSNRCLW